MNFGLRTILLLAAVVLFVIALLSDGETSFNMQVLGLAAFAGAFLVEGLGLADRTFGPGPRDNT
jgi:hypothetical protein